MRVRPRRRVWHGHVAVEDSYPLHAGCTTVVTTTTRGFHVADHDVVIRGGVVVDGTGAPGRAADVAIDDGGITHVGEVHASGREEIDADGLLVTPGWVDVHTHYDGQVTWDPLLTPSSWQGVTTVVMGNCGVGFAPVRPDRHDWLIRLMEGVEDIPGTALHEGITWGWESFPEYLDVIDSTPHAIDVGAQVPHAALRAYVMGDRGADHAEVPTDAEIATMGRLAAEAIEAGALGFSTSRTTAHRSSDGSPTPSLTATADELLGIARAIGETKRGVFEIIADLVDLDGEFALMRAMAEVSGRPMSITTLQRPEQHPDEYRDLLALIDKAVADGVELRGQVAARPVGIVLTLGGRAHPLHRVDRRTSSASRGCRCRSRRSACAIPSCAPPSCASSPRTATRSPVASRTRSRSGTSLATITGPTSRSMPPACTTR